MPDFRPRFGKDTARELVGFLAEWDGIGGACDGKNNQISAARDTIECYYRKHQELGIDVSDIVGEPTPETRKKNFQGGIKIYEPVDPEMVSHFDKIVSTRVSVRTFDVSKPVPEEIIIRAVSQAIRAPSVCNRQTWRVHQYDGENAQKILKLQSGNRGFGHTIPCILVVTSDLRYFTGTAERYQPWIDGGMFSMLLLLGLHTQGLGAVALNWSVMNKRDSELRAHGDIADHERIIMLIGCGYPVAGITVPKSHRRTPESILTRHH